jgi:hypothetical protein
MAPPPEAAHAGLAALERLRRIVESVRDTDDGKWLDAVLTRYIAGASPGVKLDEAIGVAVPLDGVPWWTERRRAERDAAIRELADPSPASPASVHQRLTTGHESSSGRPAGQVSAALPSRNPIPHQASRLTEHWRRSSVFGGSRSIWGCRFRRGQGIECHKREVCGEASDP